MKHELILEGLNCAHCAAKIEQKLIDTPEYSDVQFSFATKALSLKADKKDIIADVQSIVDGIEDGVTVKAAEDSEDDEDEEPIGKVKLALLILSAVLFVVAFVMHFFDGTAIPCAILSVIAVVLSGYDVVIEGVKSVLKLRIDETTLMTVAVIAAMILGEFVEAAAVTVLFGIGEILEDKAVEKSRRDIRKLADIRPDTALVYENGTTREVMAKDVALGTILEIAPHTRVPLDGIVTEGSTTVDASSLTGESVPVEVQEGSELLSGMMNNDRTVMIKTTKLYADSAATRIVKLVEDSAKNKGDGEKLISRFARVYTPVVILIGVLIAVIPSLITGDWATWIHRALVCLVASCPCSIVISVPLSYFAGIGAASKAGVLIKGGRFVETLAEAKCFAFDKTGTLTDHHISVKEIKSTSNYSSEEILEIASGVEAHSAHPIAAAIRDHAESLDISSKELKEYTEIPAQGISATDGAHTYSVVKAKDQSGTAVTMDDKVIGLISIAEQPRKEAKVVIDELKDLGVAKAVMLSGDKASACRKVADELDITDIYSELLPEDKVACVDKLIKENGNCCFVGDGINDAPVLTRADCGIAMGLGSDAAIESADMVLSAENLSALPKAIRICRRTMATVGLNIAFSLFVKALVIILAACGIAPLWLAVVSDTGVCLLCILNSVRLIKSKN
ncbi:MAG: cadmium-translocating P-type ATPase [Ruminococcus sp.]|nr:cadmium-translocating P-type ATPase [Ruminococcus sp.]